MASTMAPYSLPQSVFMMSLGSNALFGKMAGQAALQAELQAFLLGTAATPSPFFATLNHPSSVYPCLALGPGLTQGDWGAVWGPVVYQATANPGATNAMFVAHSPTLNIYVVAIAGTNPTGDTALFKDDLDVGPASMVQWPPTVEVTAKPQTLNWVTPATPTPSAALIDGGTQTGINALYTMWDPNTQSTLAQFLNAVDQSNQTLVFTGHSLGGALSPVMAMLLYPNAAASTNPNNATMPNLGSNWSNVYVLATAGPTPGTPGFAALYTSTITTLLPGGVAPVPVTNPPANIPIACTGSYAPVATGVTASNAPWAIRYWNMNYANVYDVVPRAWNALANLVLPPPQAPSEPSVVDLNYPSFFAAGSQLAPKTGPLDLFPAGPDTLTAVTDAMNKSGYVTGNTTPYYTPCLQHYPFNGSWGSWAVPKIEGGAVLYPSPWTASTPPCQQNPPTTVAGMSDLATWVLNAHLGQYSHALLGFPCPTITDPSS